MTTTREIAQQPQQRRYGYLSMLSLIVGIVIGSGIFFKNNSLYNSTGSAIASMFSWFIIAAIVLALVLGFVEIASASKKRNEPGSLSNWSGYFLGKSFGKIVGYFFVYVYFPIIFAVLVNAFADQINSTISATTETWYAVNTWQSFAFVTIIGILIFVVISVMNTFTSKPGKGLQVSGTAIKLIPLVLIIGTMFALMAGTGAEGMSEGWNQMWDPNSGINSQPDSPTTTPAFVRVLILALPAAMFSFDGFVFAASVQNEAKSKNTFKIALISGMFIVVFIYLFSSMAVFSIVAPTYEDSYVGESVAPTIPNALALAFPNQASWLPTTVGVIIAISILTGFSGTFIAASRATSTLSEKNYEVDANGLMLYRNKALVPQYAAIKMFALSLIWYTILRTIDGVAVAVDPQAALDAGYNFQATDVASGIVTIFGFSIYVMLIFAMLANRFTKKVEVDKTTFGAWIASLGALLMGFAIITWLISTFNYSGVDSQMEQFWYWTNVSMLFAVAAVIGFVYWWNERKVKNTSNDIFDKKQEYIDLFLQVVPWNSKATPVVSSQTTNINAQVSQNQQAIENEKIVDNNNIVLPTTTINQPQKVSPSSEEPLPSKTPEQIHIEKIQTLEKTKLDLINDERRLDVKIKIIKEKISTLEHKVKTFSQNNSQQ